jgi:hypothetical protein
MTGDELKAAHARFGAEKEGLGESFRAYRAAVEKVRTADRATWDTPDFQRFLWDDESSMTVGVGRKVAVDGAYTDLAVVDALWALREAVLPAEVGERARRIDEQFAELMARVYPQHAEQRPQARLIRLFALLFPSEVIGLVWDHRIYQLRRRLRLRTHGRGVMGQSVLIQDALRQQLGPVTDLDEQVWRNLFARWLAFGRGEDGEETDEESSGEEDLLRLRPAAGQFKGITAITGTVDMLIGIIRHAQSGATLRELIEAVRGERPNWTVDTTRSRITHVRQLKLLELRDGALRPTKFGEDLLEGAPPADVLAPILLVNNIGVAPLLDLLRRHASCDQGMVIKQLQALDPAWTTETAPRRLIKWTRSMGLVEVDEKGLLRLTDAGRTWAERLPDPLPQPVPLEVDEDLEASGERLALADVDGEEEALKPPLPSGEFTPLSFAALAPEVEASELLLEKNFFPRLHAALHATAHKRFVLLAGLSGTGKSSIARFYAEAYCKAKGCKELDAHRAIVPVRPDWTDPSGLLGYINALNAIPTWRRTTALELLLAANRRPQLPFFLILEEMNLARVEHYFAPLLTAMESPDGELRIHAEPNQIDAVPPAIRWPRNLFILGTVNMDETTFPFSDKVIDRAFFFQLWSVDLVRWRAAAVRKQASRHLDKVFPLLRELHGALAPTRRHFGYRVCDEVLGFCEAMGDATSETLDAVVMAKILPRLRGEELGGFGDALRKVQAICEEHKLEHCAAKLKMMHDALSNTGLARF